ncbi:melatonin receptor type 1B-like [Tubulanus polymorphus]|uniref:melatonin receptor type 1B-like n=1 Tax=Tubulanus polymorphus TaxID=672921 RepID=UPI003DA2B99B
MNNTTAETDDSSDTTPLGLRVFDIVIMTSIVVIGICGNVLILSAVFSSRNLRTLANAFVVNIAVADLVVVAYVLPVVVANVVERANVLGEVTCVMNAGLTVITCACSIWTLAQISVNRYIHVCKHTKYDKIYSKLNVCAMLVTTWSFWIFVTFLSIIWVEHNYNNDSKICIFDHHQSPYFTAFIMVVGIGIPVIVTFVCYYLIYRTIKSSQQRIKNHTGAAGNNAPGNNAKNNKKKRENDALKALFVAFVLFIVFWCPYGIVAILYSVRVQVNGYVFKYSAWLGMSNSCVNSFVYGVMNKTYSDAYKKIVCFWRPYCLNNSIHASTSNSTTIISHTGKESTC